MEASVEIGSGPQDLQAKMATVRGGIGVGVGLGVGDGVGVALVPGAGVCFALGVDVSVGAGVGFVISSVMKSTAYEQPLTPAPLSVIVTCE
jgi:hypothetical protein